MKIREIVGMTAMTAGIGVFGYGSVEVVNEHVSGRIYKANCEEIFAEYSEHTGTNNITVTSRREICEIDPSDMRRDLGLAAAGLFMAAGGLNVLSRPQGEAEQ